MSLTKSDLGAIEKLLNKRFSDQDKRFDKKLDTKLAKQKTEIMGEMDVKLAKQKTEIMGEMDVKLARLRKDISSDTTDIVHSVLNYDAEQDNRLEDHETRIVELEKHAGIASA